MQKRRYEILLPLTYNDGQPVPGEAVEQTREELILRFGAATLSPSPFRGGWIHSGVRYDDESICAFVDVEDTSENRQFFVELKPVLCERFRQIEIYIVSTQIDVI
jgi:hypothetical protein